MRCLGVVGVYGGGLRILGYLGGGESIGGGGLVLAGYLGVVDV